MVYYFESRDGHIIYVGKNKFENEDLIKYGWLEDVWFHADDYSSPHVYLRLKEGESWETIPETAIEDCCQLTKEGSIDGSKQESITIVYTPWRNLNKLPSMEVGAIGYHSQKEKKLIQNVTKQKDILKVISKTRKEEFPNLQEMQAYRISQQQRQKLEFSKTQQKEQIQQQQKAKEEQDLKSYKTLFQSNEYKTNKEQAEEDDDFM